MPDIYKAFCQKMFNIYNQLDNNVIFFLLVELILFNNIFVNKINFIKIGTSFIFMH